MHTAKDIIRIIEEMAPAGLALPDDPVGLQVGSPEWPVEKVMVALDADTAVISQAVEAGAGLLLSHHPLLYRPVSKIDPESPVGSAVALALENRLAVYCAHTNLDAADGGLNHILADTLGLVDRRPLSGIAGDKYKLVVYLPQDSLHDVRSAAFKAGAGRIGAYSMCSFSSSGAGTFKGSGETRPATGRTGVFEVVPELRLEMVVEGSRVRYVEDAVLIAHPYEEPAIDLYRLHEIAPTGGIGLIGSLEKTTAIGEITSILIDSLGAPSALLTADRNRRATKVAVCTGSGASFIARAQAAGAEVFVTGDVKYHDAKDAQARDLPLIDIGHFAPERFGMMETGRILGKALKKAGVNVRILYSKENNPFEVFMGAK